MDDSFDDIYLYRDEEPVDIRLDDEQIEEPVVAKAQQKRPMVVPESRPKKRQPMTEELPELPDSAFEADALEALEAYSHEDDIVDIEFDEDGFWENNDVPPIVQAAKPKAASRSSGKRGRVLFFVALALLLLTAGAATLIAEPWIPAAEDRYSGPVTETITPITLKVGDSYKILFPCEPGEIVESITSSDSDIVVVDGDILQALGEWDGTNITISTRESVVPEKDKKPASFLGMDITEPYNNIRDALRNFVGVEPYAVPRTTLRALRTVTMGVKVKGYNTEQMLTPINLFTDDNYIVRLAQLHDGEEVVFSETGILKIEKNESDDGTRSFTATSGSTIGTATLTLTLGFYKNEVFIPTRAVAYSVEVLARPLDGEAAIFTMGSYNGRIPVIDPPEEEEEPQEDTESDSTENSDDGD